AGPALGPVPVPPRHQGESPTMSRWLWLSIVLTLGALAGTLFLYTFGSEWLPAEVPVHWNIKGEADHRVPRNQVLPYLLISPGAMALMVLLTVVLPWLSPRSFDLERFRGTYEYIMFLIVALFGYIQVAILTASVEAHVDIGRLLVAGILLFFALLGNVLG